MIEEVVTLRTIAWLESLGHSILSYDYPGSGTGQLIRPSLARTRTEGVKPDILSRVGARAYYFENKPEIYVPDVLKLARIRSTQELLTAIAKSASVSTEDVRFGIAVGNLPQDVLEMHRDKLDFAVLVSESGPMLVHGSLDP